MNKNNKLFISYSHGDYYDTSNNIIIGSPVDRILTALRRNNIGYWIDEKINPGDKFAKNIGDAISECDIFVFISSALSNKSPWATGEIHTAIQMNKRIVPVKIDASPYNTGYAIYLNPLDFIDYQASPQKAIKELISISRHHQDNIRMPHVVKQKMPKSDLTIGKESLSKKVYLLFSSLTIDNAIGELLSIFDYFEKIGVEFTDGISKIQKQLTHISTLVKYDVKRQKLIELSSFSESIIQDQTRINKFLIQLTLMVIYFWLDEATAVIKIQKDIASTEFKKTWWEDYGADIVSIIAFLGGALGACKSAGASRSISQGIMRTAPSVSKENNEKLIEQQKLFIGFKDAIGSIEFYK